jgi:diguanylate cyclase
MENKEATFQEKVYALSDEFLKIMKELHQEHNKLINSKRIAKKMFTKESIKNILNNCSLEGPDSEHRVDPLKETVDRILNSFSELFPPIMIEQLSEIKDQHINTSNPTGSTGRLDSAVSLVKKYIDSISSRINELEDLIKKTVNFLSKMENSLISGLSAVRGKYCDDSALEIRVSSDMSVMKKSVETSNDIETIRSVVINKIENITNALEQKKEQDMLRLEEMEKTFEALSNKMSYLVNETQAISKRSLETVTESYNDNLTALYNRKAYDKKIKETLADLDRYNAPASLLIFDIDNFKEINDNFGHLIGDLTLKKFAHLLKEKSRINDFIARYGGDEFVCILPNTQLEGTRQAAEKIRSFIDRTSFVFKDKEIPVTISAGISTFRAGDDTTTVFHRADIALYLAKHSGRNMVKTEDDVEKEGKNFSHYLIETGFKNE